MATAFASPHQFIPLEPSGALLCSALLLVPRRMQQDVPFILGVLLLSVLSQRLLYQQPFADAVLIALTFWLQGLVGFFLFRIFNLEHINFERMEVAFNYLALGCLLPSALLACIPAVVLNPEPLPLPLTWAYWFSQLSLAAVLFSSVILLMEIGKHQARCWPLVPLLAWLATGALTFAIFNQAWVLSYGVPPESFIFVPLYGIFTAYFSMRINAWILTSNGLLALYLLQRAQGSTSIELEIRNYLLLSLLIIAIHTLNLLITALLTERDRSLVRIRRSKRMYEALSAINQEMVGDNYSEAEVFEKVCRIVTHKIGVEQTSVAVCGFPPTAADEPQLVQMSQLYIYPTNQCLDTGDTLQLAPERLQQSAGFSRFEYATLCSPCQKNCQFNQVFAYPIYKHGRLYALLSVFDSTGFEFDEAVQALFERLAKNITFALSAIESRQQLNLINEVFEYGHESIVITDPSGQIIKVNPAFSRITGYSADEVIGQNPRILKSGRQDPHFYQALWHSLVEQGSWSGEFWNKKKSGQLYLQRGTISVVRNVQGEIEHLIAIMEDITEQRAAAENIRRLANFDMLTGLANRNSLMEQFYLLTEQAYQRDKQLVAMFIDLDDFKHVNDAMGHQFGDALLKAVALRFQRVLTAGEQLYRFSGDEFVLLAPYDSISSVDLAEAIIQTLSYPFEIGEQTVNIGCSIGIAISGTDGTSLDQLVGSADAAMYRAKASGRGTYAFFSAEMQTDAMEKFTLKRALAQALEQHEFELYYQPKVRIMDNEVMSAEALVRWQHPQRGQISPAYFIPLAEQSGQIVQIDLWVLETVIAQLGQWLAQGLAVKPVALNMSLPMFQRPQFIEELKYLLERYGVPSHLVELEITERVAMGDFNYTVSTLKALRALGVTIAIDDFGTGYSSMSYLFDFPISTLKIDRAFVTDIDQDSKKQGIVNAIISLANTMELTTVAEGIESEQEKQLLMLLGCDYYQGFHFSKPIPAADFAARYLAPATQRDQPSSAISKGVTA
ncbi:EAL domain-containing protein [Shewanella sp.]|uniref:bifunctional diguanylate cyclase/phosphodiesterase n=1 Tax=Shewanella sp. TaxID=50422 RepID=UPI003A981853